MKKSLVPIALAFALIAVAPVAFAAGSQSGTLTLNSSVAANCTIGAATLDFGAYDPVVTNASSPKNGSTTMAVACTKGFIPNITTATAGGTITGSGGSLPYTLYSDNLYQNTFVSPGFNMPAAPGRAPQNLTIYGQIPAGQDVGVGSYTGTILVTVNF